jgi:hypothetical protein
MRVTTVLMMVATFAVLSACSSKPQNFDSPEAAATALFEAAKADGNSALLKVLGKKGRTLVDSGDEVADKNARAQFVEKYTTAMNLDKTDPEFVTLEVGEDKWPFPVPIISEGGKWHFDTPTGIDEVVNRRVGANELDTIQSCLAYVDAQREYYSLNPEKSSLQHYAGKLISADGKKDGLYWPASESEPQSPIGEGFAAARAEGYEPKDGSMKGVPYHGYIYRQLTKQGPNARGGAYDYLVNDQLMGGFAVVAFPAEYGNSGVMTFMVNHDGVVFSKDLGPDTAKLAMAIESFDPGPDWKKEAAEEQTAAVQ